MYSPTVLGFIKLKLKLKLKHLVKSANTNTSQFSIMLKGHSRNLAFTFLKDGRSQETDLKMNGPNRSSRG